MTDARGPTLIKFHNIRHWHIEDPKLKYAALCGRNGTHRWSGVKTIDNSLTVEKCKEKNIKIRLCKKCLDTNLHGTFVRLYLANYIKEM